MEKKHVPFTEAEQHFIRRAVDERTKAQNKFPLFFGLLITFGFVATLYGLEKLIDRMPFFVNNPWVLLAIGVSTLMLTGTAYKKLN